MSEPKTDPKIEPLFDAEAIRQRVTALGERLESDRGAEDPMLVALVGGSVVFVADLVRAVSRPLRFEFIQVQYGAGGHEGEILEIHYPISLDVAGQDLVIIKDVSTTGVIETYLGSQFLQHGARAVHFAVLIDVPEERKTDFKPDYSLFTATQSGIFVGYGLKYRGRYGNLPYIGLMERATAAAPGPPSAATG